MEIVSEKHDTKNGIWMPTIAFKLPHKVIEYSLTFTEDMIRESGICPLVFLREIEQMLATINYRLLTSSVINSKENRDELIAEVEEGIRNALKRRENEDTQL